jgi:hypothetical protein
MRRTMVVTTTAVRIRIVSRSVACRVVGLTWVSYAACIPLLSTKYVCLFNLPCVAFIFSQAAYVRLYELIM